METLLSKLLEGQIFAFKNDQEAFYILRDKNFQRYATNEVIEFCVLKKHEKSVKVITVVGSIEYTFKFEGFFPNYVPGKDCTVYLRESVPNE